jgi:hypothetical protein
MSNPCCTRKAPAPEFSQTINGALAFVGLFVAVPEQSEAENFPMLRSRRARLLSRPCAGGGRDRHPDYEQSASPLEPLCCQTLQ